ncbi:uncharacterized protein LOC110111451 [Dendrobium catenatum]|uniref:uncharacterized protein LOC110111451 n=1 Tax=Dendrobium catenatum TaxID=906689 RepID=UPI0009F43F7C|nr:uncharacterized protein LOC110111451 [Dendrobium catenatum]
MEEESNRRRRSSEQLSWRGTLLTQAALCLALYGAFSIGTPQQSRKPGLMSGRTRRRELMDFYFLSVRGGFWPADEKSQLLQQMSRTAVLYDAKFVVNIGDLGQDDPLMQHASLNFPMLKIPWYTTTAGNSTLALSGKSKKYFLKKIKIAYDQTLDIIGIETGLFQDFTRLEEMKESESAQLYWMHQILSVTDSKWRIVVGFHPLMVCQEKHTQNSIVFYQPIHQIFLNYGVDAYLSQLGCAGQHYNIGGIAYLGNPGPILQEQIPFSETGDFNIVNERSEGFLLHRVTPLEIESYFINLAGMVVSISKIHQQGRGVM